MCSKYTAKKGFYTVFFYVVLKELVVIKFVSSKQ